MLAFLVCSLYLFTTRIEAVIPVHMGVEITTSTDLTNFNHANLADATNFGASIISIVWDASYAAVGYDPSFASPWNLALPNYSPSTTVQNVMIAITGTTNKATPMISLRFEGMQPSHFQGTAGANVFTWVKKVCESGQSWAGSTKQVYIRLLPNPNDHTIGGGSYKWEGHWDIAAGSSVGGGNFKTMYRYVVDTCRNSGGNTAFKWVWTVKHSAPTTGVPGGGEGNDLPSVPSAKLGAGKYFPNYCSSNSHCDGSSNDVYGIAAVGTTYPIPRGDKEVCNTADSRCYAPWNKIEKYWPGSSYVDWICIEGYNLYLRGPTNPTREDTDPTPLTGDDLRNSVSTNAGYFNRQYFSFGGIVDSIYKKVTGIDGTFQNALEGPSVVTKPIMVLTGTRDFGNTKCEFMNL